MDIWTCAIEDIPKHLGLDLSYFTNTYQGLGIFFVLGFSFIRLVRYQLELMFIPGIGDTGIDVGNIKNPSGVVIWMHGLADSPSGWQDFAEQTCDAMAHGKARHVKWHLPCAPTNPVTCNGGVPCRSWMDLIDIPISPETPDNGNHLDASLKIIHDIIDKEISTGIDPSRIVVGGFSQGGALALAAALKYPQKLGGVAVFSGWALPKQGLDEVLKRAPSKTSSFFIGHGMSDDVVTFECAQQVNTFLEDGGCTNVTFKSYAGMGHQSCSQEHEDFLQFLSAIM
jgi:lysophospholipase-2